MDPKDTLRAIRSLIDVALRVHDVRALHIMLKEMSAAAAKALEPQQQRL
jgi:hypothetical protein